MMNKKMVKKKDVIKLSRIIFFPYMQMEGKQNRKQLQLQSDLRYSDKWYYTFFEVLRNI